MVDLNPTRGDEQAVVRPALVASADTFNHAVHVSTPGGLNLVAEALEPKVEPVILLPILLDCIRRCDVENLLVYQRHHNFFCVQERDRTFEATRR